MKIGLILALCFSFFTVAPPSDDVWKILSELKFDIRFDKKLDDVIFTPKPSKAIKKLIGKRIIIQAFKSKVFEREDFGSEEHAIYLCRYESEEMSCCSSPEAEYIEALPNEAIKLVEGKRYLFKGILKLNTKDYLNLPFILKDAECLNCGE
jgi:hypothetical protein